MTPPRPITSIIADSKWCVGCEITARPGTMLVNGTAYRMPHIAFKRNTAWCCLVGATHTDERFRQRHGHFHWHTGK